MTARRGRPRIRILSLLAFLMLAGTSAAWAGISPDSDRDELGECKRGYYALGQTCMPVELPNNARLDSTGHTWVCRSGFYLHDTQCLPVKIPAHAKLDGTGHGWACEKGYYIVENRCEIVCDRGFQRVGEKCVATAARAKVPDGAACKAGFTQLGDGTCAPECARGARWTGDHCDVLRVPANASLDKSGHTWACNSGYFLYGEGCGRVCDKGFIRDASDRCQPVAVPANATLDRSGHNWTCNTGFIAQDNACVPVPLDSPPPPHRHAASAKKEKTP
jgi:hypothetical protein